MQRRWAVRANPATGEVDRMEVQEAFADLEALLHRAGGVANILTQRSPTDLEGEAVTTLIVFDWMDRADGYRRPRPEQPQQEIPTEDLVPVPDVGEAEEDLSSVPEEQRGVVA